MSFFQELFLKFMRGSHIIANQQQSGLTEDLMRHCLKTLHHVHRLCASQNHHRE